MHMMPSIFQGLSASMTGMPASMPQVVSIDGPGNNAHHHGGLQAPGTPVTTVAQQSSSETSPSKQASMDIRQFEQT
eukprot:4588827-Karenia_brevis.AAC.1